MATPKISAPNPAAFNSDPIEQIYSRGVLDRDMSGLAFMLANAAQDRGAANQQQYLQGVQAANQQAMQLSREEERQKMLLEVLKGSLDLAKNGYQPANMPALGQVFDDRNAPDVREPSSAANALLRAQAIAALAKASGGGGGSGDDRYVIEEKIDPLGDRGDTTIRRTTKNPGTPMSPALLEQMRIDAENKRRARASGTGGVKTGPGAEKPYSSTVTK